MIGVTSSPFLQPLNPFNLHSEWKNSTIIVPSDASYFPPKSSIPSDRRPEVLFKPTQLLRRPPSRDISSSTSKLSYTQRLRNLIESRSLEKAMECYAETKDNRVEPGVVLESMLIDALMKSDRMRDAFKVFDEMPERNVVSWTSMISGCARNGYPDIGFSLFVEMLDSGVMPNDFSLNAALICCADMSAICLGEQVHSLIVRSGVEGDCRTANCLIDFYSKCGLMAKAKLVFDGMLQMDLVSYTSLITGLCRNNLFESAVGVFDQMIRRGTEPNEHTITSILMACGLQLGEQIHGYMVKSMIAQSVFSASALIDLYSRNQQFGLAKEVFKKLEAKNVVSWSSVISSCIRNEKLDDALQLFHEMVSEGVNPNEFTFATVIGACGLSTKFIEFGQQLHCLAIKHNLDFDIRVSNALLTMYGRSSRIEELERVFQKIGNPDIVSWSAAISSYFQNGFDLRSINFLSQMHMRGYTPNEYALSSALSSCASLTLLDQGRQFHCLSLKLGCDLDICTGNSLINMYSKCGCIKDARLAFDVMCTHDITSWNSLIHGYAHHGYASKVLEVFHKMEASGSMPDHSTFVGILFGCSHGGLLDEAERYFKLMKEQYGIVPSSSHYSCMIDLMGRIGRLEEALTIIDNMPFEPDILIWKTLLGSCRLYRNVEIGKLAAEKVMQLSTQDSASYVLMSNLHAMHEEWEDAERLRRMMDEMGVKKDAGWSWIQIKTGIYTFVARDMSHPEAASIYQRLGELFELMKDEGYSPDVSPVLDEL
ncbi:pentatricopeptide repeat-containing protein At2g27610-like [Typha angustifolia]|uniref:pentatricopeptide repeat-containing protein At2g27610-like n=1 Tax=Typha angustifolia TaxID=59011 RepID=UPI003C2D0A7B